MKKTPIVPNGSTKNLKKLYIKYTHSDLVTCNVIEHYCIDYYYDKEMADLVVHKIIMNPTIKEITVRFPYGQVTSEWYMHKLVSDSFGNLSIEKAETTPMECVRLNKSHRKINTRKWSS